MCKQCKPWIIISIGTITVLFAILVTTVTIVVTYNNYYNFIAKPPKPRKKIIPREWKIFDFEWLKKFKNSSKLIFPGTKWCGEDDIADSINDLGKFKEEDKCCRKHDHCPEIIPRNKVKNYGLKDIGQRVALHCDCDKELYQCFKRIDSSISRTIGRLYFNFGVTKCFKKDHPIIECTKWESNYTAFAIFSVYRCMEYRLNATQKKIYQWFDNPLYY